MTLLNFKLFTEVKADKIIISAQFHIYMVLEVPSWSALINKCQNASLNVHHAFIVSLLVSHSYGNSVFIYHLLHMLEGPNYLSRAVVMTTEPLLDGLLFFRLKLGGCVRMWVNTNCGVFSNGNGIKSGVNLVFHMTSVNIAEPMKRVGLVLDAGSWYLIAVQLRSQIFCSEDLQSLYDKSGIYS